MLNLSPFSVSCKVFVDIILYVLGIIGSSLTLKSAKFLKNHFRNGLGGSRTVTVA